MKSRKRTKRKGILQSVVATFLVMVFLITGEPLTVQAAAWDDMRAAQEGIKNGDEALAEEVEMRVHQWVTAREAFNRETDSITGANKGFIRKTLNSEVYYSGVRSALMTPDNLDMIKDTYSQWDHWIPVKIFSSNRGMLWNNGSNEFGNGTNQARSRIFGIKASDLDDGTKWLECVYRRACYYNGRWYDVVMRVVDVAPATENNTPGFINFETGSVTGGGSGNNFLYKNSDTEPVTQVSFTREKPGICAAFNHSVSTKVYFYESSANYNAKAYHDGTQTYSAKAVKGYTTLWEIDNYQGIYSSNANLLGDNSYYIKDGATIVDLERNNGKIVFDITGEDRTANNPDSTVMTTFQGTFNAQFLFRNGGAMSLSSEKINKSALYAPEKYIVTPAGQRVTEYTAPRLDTTFTYRIIQSTPEEIPDNLAASYTFTDKLEVGQSLNGTIKVYNGDGKDITSKFTTSVNGQTVTITTTNVSYVYGDTITIDIPVKFNKDIVNAPTSDGGVVVRPGGTLGELDSGKRVLTNTATVSRTFANNTKESVNSNQTIVDVSLDTGFLTSSAKPAKTAAVYSAQNTYAASVTASTIGEQFTYRITQVVPSLDTLYGVKNRDITISDVIAGGNNRMSQVSTIKMQIDNGAITELNQNYFTLVQNDNNGMALTANVGSDALYGHTYTFYITGKLNLGVAQSMEGDKIALNNTVTTTFTAPVGTPVSGSASAKVLFPSKVKGTINLQKNAYQLNADGSKTPQIPLLDAWFRLQYLAKDGSWKNVNNTIYKTEADGQILAANSAYELTYNQLTDCQMTTDGKYQLRVVEIQNTGTGVNNPSKLYECAEVGGEVVKIDYTNLNVYRTFNISDAGGATDLTGNPIVNVHKEVEGFVSIEKMESETGKLNHLSGAVFELLIYNCSTGGWDHVTDLVEIKNRPGFYETEKEIVKENYPDVYIQQGVNDGRMLLREKTAPDGYYNDIWQAEFNLADFEGAPGNTLSYTFDNNNPVLEKYKKGDLVISKTNAEDSSKKVEGATYVVRAAEDIYINQVDAVMVKKGDMITTGITTGADGKAVVKDLYPGKYEVVETACPDDYVLDPTVYTVDVEAGTINVLNNNNNLNVVDEPVKATPVIALKSVHTEGITLTNGRYSGTRKNGAFNEGEAAKYDVTITNTGNVNCINLTVEEKPNETLLSCITDSGIQFFLENEGVYKTAKGKEVKVSYANDAKTSVLVERLDVGDSLNLVSYGFVKEGKAMIYDLPNTVEISSAKFEHNHKELDVAKTAEMTDTDNIDIPGTPDIVVTKVSDRATVEKTMEGEEGGRQKIIYKTSGIGKYLPGETITYTAYIVNNGTCDLTKVKVEEKPSEELLAALDSIAIEYPADMYYKSEKGEMILITKEDDLNMSLSGLKAGDGVAVTIKAVIKNDPALLGSEKLLNEVGVNGIYYKGEIATGGGGGSVIIPGEADIAIAKVANHTSGVTLTNGRYVGDRVREKYKAGDDIEFTFVVTNRGTAAASTITVTDTISSQQMQVLDADSLAWNIPESGSYASANGNVVEVVSQEVIEGEAAEGVITQKQYVLTLKNLPKQDSVEIKLTGKVKDSFQSTDNGKNVVTLTAKTMDGDDEVDIPVSEDMTDEEIIIAEGNQPKLVVTKYADKTKGVELQSGVNTGTKKPGTYEQGDKITYNLVVTNTGETDMTDVIVTDVISEELASVVKSSKSGFLIPSDYTFTTAFGNTCLVKKTKEAYTAGIESYYTSTWADRYSVVIDRLMAGDSVTLTFTMTVASRADTASNVPNVAVVYGKYVEAGETLTTSVSQDNMDEELIHILGDSNVVAEKSCDEEYAHPSSEVGYTLDKVRNNTSEPLENFTLTDTLPKGTALKELSTGTYNDDFTYEVYYKTNTSSDTILWADDLHSDESTTLKVSDLGLAEDEYVTEFSICYGEVAAGFSEVKKPTYVIMCGNSLKEGSNIVNTLQARAYLNGKALKDKQKLKTPVGGPVDSSTGNGGNSGGGNGGNSYGYNAPQTGDYFSYALYIVIAALAIGAIVWVVRGGRKKEAVDGTVSEGEKRSSEEMNDTE